MYRHDCWELLVGVGIDTVLSFTEWQIKTTNFCPVLMKAFLLVLLYRANFT